MTTRATDNGVDDGWRGARIGTEHRDREQRARLHIPAAIDLGEPEPPRVVITFLAIALVATLLEFATFGASPDTGELSRAGGAGIGVIATGAWWKLLTANLLHANIPHLLMNVFVTYLTGRWLEHLVGRTIVVATIAWSMVLAGIGSIIVDTPSVSIGASGVAFGVIGCAIGADPRARTATGIIARQLAIVNVIITFLIPGISVGGHFGGLLAGLLVGFACWDRSSASEAHPAGRPRRPLAPALVVAAIVPAAILAIGPGPWPNEARDLRSGITSHLLQRQLDGAELSSGRDVDEATCEGTDDVLRYACELDGRAGAVTFREHDDQWRLLGG